MVSAILSRIVILVFGTLYPAYASYKAVRTKNVKEYVKWMMYWIVFALFSAGETFSDVFLSWLPFYYELKIVFVVWMLSPMTQGSSFLFKKFVHPHLAKREKEIDEMIAQASKQGYSTLLSLGTKGISYASQFMMKTAIMGQSKLVDHLRRSYSTSDLSNDGHTLVQRHDASGEEEGEDELDNRLREDNAELEGRTGNRTKLGRSKSAATASSYSLSSVKEETEGDGEEEEKVITETFSVPASTKRHYSLKEDNQAGEHRRRIKSLSPPVSGLSQTTSVAAKVKLQQPATKPSKSVLSKEDPKDVAPVPRIVELKRNLFTRSQSQDNIIIKRGKVQVLKGLSDDRKRSLLQRAQSEDPSYATQAQAGWKRAVTKVVSQARQEKSGLMRPAGDSAHEDTHTLERKSKTVHPLKSEGSSWTTVDEGPTLMRSGPDGLPMSLPTAVSDRSPESLRTGLPTTVPDRSPNRLLTSLPPSITEKDSGSRPTNPSSFISERHPDRLATSLSSTDMEGNDKDLVSDASEWHLVDETDELIRDIEIDTSGSAILFIDADDEIPVDPSENFGFPGPTSCDFIHNNTLNPSETLYASEMSDSDEDDVNSFSDSCETLRSSPENEGDVLMGTGREFSSDGSIPLKSKSSERVLEMILSEHTFHESGCRSLPGSPSIARGLLFEDIEEEEECQQSVSTPNSPLTEPRSHQPPSRPRRGQRLPGRHPLTRQARQSPTTSPPKTFDPFRSWVSQSRPSPTYPSAGPAAAPISLSAPLLLSSHGQPMERLYTRSCSVDSRDSWYHTYPRVDYATNRGSPGRGQTRSRSVSYDRDSFPIHRFRQLSQDPAFMSLKPERKPPS